MSLRDKTAGLVARGGQDASVWLGRPSGGWLPASAPATRDAFGLPHSRPMPDIGPGCHELRIVDGAVNWRIMYHIAPDAIVILDVFPKKTAATPNSVIAECRKRLAEFQRVIEGQKGANRARR